jgi:hypothetical protein
LSASLGPACHIQADSGENPAPLSLDCHFYSNKYTKNGGAKGIRTPDLLHAIQCRAVAGRGPASPGLPFTCANPGPMWLDAARRLLTLAPNLAPRKLVSSANVQRIEQAVGRALSVRPGRPLRIGALAETGTRGLLGAVAD